MPRIALFALMIWIAFASNCAFAQGCTREQADRAERQVDDLHSWAALHAAYRQFRQCDDGAIAEGYSDAVAKILAQHWQRLPEVLPLIRSDPGFETWFIRHLDETDAFDDLMKIDRSARAACPRGMRELCVKIHDQLRSGGCSPKYPESVACRVQALTVQ